MAVPLAAALPVLPRIPTIRTDDRISVQVSQAASRGLSRSARLDTLPKMF
jgi:hypothetical protein